MARPRKPSDPTAWPVPCGRCGGHYQIVAKWPDGGVCGYCYQQAKRTRGTCRCGHVGVLPGRVDDEPACRRCSGVKLNVDCALCGAEDELYRGGRCQRCELAAHLDRLLTNPSTGVMAAELLPVADALKAMSRPNSGLTWIRQRHVTAFLQELSSAPTVSHATLDQLPASRTRDYMRGLLVEHGALPRRDESRARFQQWADQALERVTDPTMRDVAERYIRWHHLRRMNQTERVKHGTFLRSKQSVTVAIDLLNWLTAHGLALSDLQQPHLDRWVVTGPSTRLIADRFLRWAINSRLVAADLTLPKHRRGTSPRLNAVEQDQALHQVVHAEDLTPRDRAAAILVLVFAQPIEKIVRLTWDDVTVTDDLVTVSLAGLAIALPDPLNDPWRRLAADPGHDQTAAHPNSNWVFRGHSPGRPIAAATLRERLRAVFGVRAARLGTLSELSQLAPVAIIAETLGYSPATVERHAIDAAAIYAAYIGSVRPSTWGSPRPSCQVVGTSGFAPTCRAAQI